MARRSGGEAVLRAPGRPGREWGGLRLAFTILTAAACCLGAATVFWKVEEFLIAGEEFVLPGPPEPGRRSEHFRIEGTQYASMQQITRVFLEDFGRSIYLCPIAERRRQLLAVDWVKDASVTRIWPNQLVIQVTERSPVAFVQVPAGRGAMSYSLVDSEGVLLGVPHNSRFDLPVLAGLPVKEPEERRRLRVKSFLRLQAELGPLMDQMSEIDVSDLENIKVIHVFEGRAFTLMLGREDFGRRLRNFIENGSEIRRRLPDASILDLRLEGRITAFGGSGK